VWQALLLPIIRARRKKRRTTIILATNPLISATENPLVVEKKKSIV